MSDNSIFNRLSIKLKKKIGKPKYGKRWPELNDEWYKKIHNENFLIHEHFKKYLKSKIDITTILEIGCGTGIYPINNNQLFKNLEYTGIDISSSAIDFCKKNSKFTFICGDFIKMSMNKKYDLVYTHAVVDHVYDIDEFISKIVDSTNHYVYINSYRGFFPDLQTHKMKWDGYDGSYFNNISIPQIKKLFTKIGISEDEYKIFSQESGQQGENVNLQTIIEINKKISN